MTTVKKGVTLYTEGTPNGWKASVLLKELKYPHTVRHVSMSKNEQKEDWYLKINPNGRIPAIVDHDNGDYAVFESGAIMMYLAEKAGKLYPQDFDKRHQVNQWLMFQMAGVGPMQGQANHFIRFAPDKIAYGMKRYQNETKRLFEVLNTQLSDKDWLAADEYTIADIANWCWVYGAPFIGIDIEADFPHLCKWAKRIEAREEVQAGIAVPERSEFVGKLGNEEAKKNWIQEANDIVSKA